MMKPKIMKPKVIKLKITKGSIKLIFMEPKMMVFLISFPSLCLAIIIGQLEYIGVEKIIGLGSMAIKNLVKLEPAIIRLVGAGFVEEHLRDLDEQIGANGRLMKFTLFWMCD